MKKVILLVVLCGIGFYVYSQSQGDLRKAFEQHQQQEFPGVKAFYPQVGGESFVLSERWKNYQKYAQNCPAIAEVVTVEINKTSDGGDYVIRMAGPNRRMDKDGFEKDVCSLWVNGGKENEELEVRDFSDY